MLHSPEIIKQHLRKYMEGIKLEVINRTIKNHIMHVNAYPFDEELATLEIMIMWITKARFLELTLELVASKT